MVSKSIIKPGIMAFFMILSMIFTLPIVSGEVFYTDFFITLKDINSEKIVKSMPVDLSWYRYETGGTVNLTKYLDKRGTFSYRISPGKWRLHVFVDNRSTPETDYYGESIYTLTGDLVTRGETLYVDPVGSLELIVSDASGNLVAGAELDFKCKSYRSTATTDRFGSYKAENLPVGECKVSAAYTNLVGSAVISIVKGHTVNGEIMLSENVIIPPIEAYKYYIGAAVILVLLLLYYTLIRKRIKRHVKEEVAKTVKKKHAKKAKLKKVNLAKEEKKKEKKEEELNPRARDIMKTLNEKEQKVVNFLLENKHKSTQATIRNETGIPKTTLARVFQALEAKKVIKIETIGKLKKIELTDWFLGKE